MRNKEKDFRTLSEAFDEAKEYLTDRKAGKPTGFKTGWKDLNRILGGDLPFECNLIIGGISGVGKSAFTNILLLDIYENNKELNIITLYWNFEMTSRGQAMRLISSGLGKSVTELRRSPTIEDIMRVEQIKEKFDYSILFYDIPRTVEEIYITNEEIYNSNPGANIINIIDHTKLVKDTDNKADKNRITHLLDGFTFIKKKFKTTNIILSQLNRESGKTGNHYVIPTAKHLSSASEVYEYADIIFMLFRPETEGEVSLSYGDMVFDTENVMFINIAKARDGAVGLTKLAHDLKSNKLYDYDDNI